MELNFLGKGVSLSEIGVNEYVYAWKHVDAVLSEIKKLNLVILGGDVYIEKNHRMTLTYDSWYYNRLYTPSDCKLSIDKARGYIYDYIEKNGDLYYFSFIL
ncbi:hypothetical protein BVE84_10120 [Streptococcus azizii]|uniref:Immunity protein 40 domain-containing protein n=2 Tax=Streptococcus azizii TaxID=1579424 RepID=A0AB36JN47_9STRE|nr:hypothetical protein BVE86_10395 [Streptococcus azizii]ONK25418.1 hypothetical protein BVE85_10135 [Streptococcus azizii]ONK25547.1 hypothetical protein BVE84_10120 [Streptococcus azizii]